MTETPRVTVIGLGLMGSALARAYCGAGYEVTVWNRSSEKAEPFHGLARIASSASEAANASDVVVVSLSDHEVSRALLGEPGAAGALAGKLIVQLSSGTPSDARESQAWAAAHGARYLDGIIMGYPRSIGSPGMTILYSGPREHFEHSLAVLEVLAGDTRFVGEEIGTAAALDLAFLDVIFGMATALLHGAAICEANAVSLDDCLGVLSDYVPEWLVPFATMGVRDGVYERGSSAMTTNAASMHHVVRASGDAEIDPSFPSAILRAMVVAVERGHGSDDLPALYEAFRPGDDARSS